MEYFSEEFLDQSLKEPLQWIFKESLEESLVQSSENVYLVSSRERLEECIKDFLEEFAQ